MCGTKNTYAYFRSLLLPIYTFFFNFTPTNILKFQNISRLWCWIAYSSFYQWPKHSHTDCLA